MGEIEESEAAAVEIEAQLSAEHGFSGACLSGQEQVGVRLTVEGSLQVYLGALEIFEGKGFGHG
jgi:hypothetical protein